MAPQSSFTVPSGSAIRYSVTDLIDVGFEYVRRMLTVLPMFASVWLVLTNATLSSWVVGVVAVAAAVWLNSAFFRPPDESGYYRVNPLGLLAFIPFFMVQSLRGGVETAMLALRPSMPVSPAFVQYRTSLPTQSTRVLFAHVLSLLPGSVSTRLTTDILDIHFLRQSTTMNSDILNCEKRIAAIFGLKLPDGETQQVRVGGAA